MTKLCISIRPKDKQSLYSLIQEVKDKQALIELRTDDIDVSVITEKNLFIITAGTKKIEDIKRLAALDPMYIDIPFDRGEELFREIKEYNPKVKLIASYHSYSTECSDLPSIYKKIRRVPCDLIKMATHAETSVNALRMLAFVKEMAPKFPLTAVSMGECGEITRILSPIFGSCIMYSCLEGQSVAPGQLSYDELVFTYNFFRLSPTTKPFALLGHPIKHSLSHKTHNNVFRQLGIDACYVKIAVLESEITEAITLMQSLKFAGCSVTMPHKFAFASYCNKKNASYNTVCFKNNDVHLCNTDGPGALDAIEEYGKVMHKKLLIIGAGATGVAIYEEALKRGAKAVLCNRGKKEISYPVKSFDELQRELLQTYAVINATKVGMKEDDAALPLQKEWLPEGVLALDVVTKDKTKFLQLVEEAHGIPILGMEMFLRQAAKQFCFWFENIDETKVLEALRRALLPSVRVEGKKRGCLHGTITPPPSKSHTLRALLFASFAEGISTIENPLLSPDTEAMITVCKAFGADIEQSTAGFKVHGVGKHRSKLNQNMLDAKNSGIVLRFGAAVSTLFSESAFWTGDTSLKTLRNSRALLDALSQLGVVVSSDSGYAPFALQGPLQPGKVTLCGKDSQPVSALLIAAALMEGTTEITVTNPGEKPWINLTLHWLKQAGIDVVVNGYEKYTVHGKGYFTPFHYKVPADWSSALFPIALALITESDLTINSLDFSDVQGDKEVLKQLMKMGASFAVDEERGILKIRGPQQLQGVDIDVNCMIDALPILAVLAASASGKTELTNAAIARNKESDRLASITRELTKMGASIMESKDKLTIQGGVLQGALLYSYDDHRMALSLTCAALSAVGPSIISDVACIKKTYPHFFEELKRIGGAVV